MKIKLFKWLISIFLLFSSASCYTLGEGDPSTKFALEAIKDNILTTDYTALVEITQVNTSDSTQASAAEDGEALLAVIYRAKVLQSYQGNGAERIEYIQYTEKSEGLEGLSSGMLIVSLCRDRDGSLYLPDVGYELPAEKALLEKAQEIKALLDAKRLALRRGDDYACCSRFSEPCP